MNLNNMTNEQHIEAVNNMSVKERNTHIRILNNLMMNAPSDSMKSKLTECLNNARFTPKVGVTGMKLGSKNGRNMIDVQFVRDNYVVKCGKLYHKVLDRCFEWLMPITGGADTYKSHVTIDGKYYNAHRLIYVWHHGVNIDDVNITHIDGDWMNNDINNLAIREVA